jgi:hypothetical protein
MIQNPLSFFFQKPYFKNCNILLTVTLNVSLEQDPPEVPGAVVASLVPEGPRRVKDSKSRRKKQTSERLG